MPDIHFRTSDSSHEQGSHLHMLEQITPIILTRNESPNIGSRLRELRWASDIVVVDSFSDDDTVEIVSSFPQARVFQRAFDIHASQWNFALNETGITSDWVLALDADYHLPAPLMEELKRLRPAEQTAGYQAQFEYCIKGRPIRCGLYPPKIVLYRRRQAAYIQDGHTQRVIIDGQIEHLNTQLLHDDRKPLRTFIEAQQRYAALEAKKIHLADPNDLSMSDRIRRFRLVAPAAVFFYCWILRGGILDGWPGFYYASQRVFAELLLSLYLLDGDIRPRDFERWGVEHASSQSEPVSIRPANQTDAR
jgi:glycosyltransferase involved in cell wall biosynthesis